ncbi:hypothetical protein LQK93_01671 [Terrabacter sp. BE26]
MSPEEVAAGFAAWFDLDKSGVPALDELLNTIPPEED